MQRHQARLFSYIFFMVKDRHKAEDLFQETCIKAITSIRNGGYSHDGRFIPWITRIAHNHIIDFFRMEKMLNCYSTDDFSLPALNTHRFSTKTIEENMVIDQIHADLRKLIDYLPDEQREIILMRHYGELSFKEIAEQTGVSINTALGRMRYALSNLRKIIKKNGIQITVSGV